MAERWSDKDHLTKIYVPLTEEQWQQLIDHLRTHNNVVVMGDGGIITFVKRGRK